jgi:hypothetical protein
MVNNGNNNIIIIKQKMDIITKKIIETWQGERMHGQFPRNLDEKVVDNEQLYQRLKSGSSREKQ